MPKKLASRVTKTRRQSVPAAFPAPFVARSLRRQQFSCVGDAHIDGDLSVATVLVVGGDLLVDGDLEAEEIFCLGKLTVRGQIRAQSLYVGDALDAGGDIEVEFLLKTACSAEWMARMLESESGAELESKSDQAANKKAPAAFLDKLVHPLILQRQLTQNSHQNFARIGSIHGLGSLQCDVLDCQGDVQLDYDLDANEVLYVGGHLSADVIHVQGDCHVKGELMSTGDITISGTGFAGEVVCQGNLMVGSICSQADISAWGLIRADGEISSLQGEIASGRWIATKATIYAAKYIKAAEAIVAEKGLSCGEDYGILAATNVRRSRWKHEGFVAAPTMPAHLLSGAYSLTKKRRHLDALEKKREVELEWEIERRLNAQIEVI